MASIGSSIAATVSGGLQPGTSPKMYNVTTPGTANTEASQTLTNSTKQFTIRVRGRSKLQLAYAVGESSTNYMTVPAGTTMSVDNLNFSGTLYFQVDKASQVVEIQEWS